MNKKDEEIKRLRTIIKNLAEVSKSFIAAASGYFHFGNSCDKEELKIVLSEQLSALEYAIKIAEENDDKSRRC